LPCVIKCIVATCPWKLNMPTIAGSWYIKLANSRACMPLGFRLMGRYALSRLTCFVEPTAAAAAALLSTDACGACNQYQSNNSASGMV